jgi:CheY-like chemotaxis protein
MMQRSLELPRGSHEETRFGDAQQDRSRVSAAPPRRRLLVVDDEPLFGKTMSLLLGEQHEVIVEPTGRQGLRRMLDDGWFDLVLCDVSLPDLDGPAIYARLASERPEVLERFVFVTGGVFHDSVMNFFSTYRGLLLEKPFPIDTLEILIESRARLSA